MDESRRVRALAALAALLALVGGVPAALAATIGNPAAALPDLLAGDITDAALIALLAAVAWVAWAQFAVVTTVELISAVRRTPVPRRLPGVLAGQQQLARSLVTAVFLLVPAAASAVLPAPASTASAALPPPASPVTISALLADTSQGAPTGQRTAGSLAGSTTAQATAAASSSLRPAGRGDATPAAAPASTTLYVVPADGGPATLWDIAHSYLGQGERWGEIWLLNEGRSQPDGSTMTSPRRLLPGWTVLVPGEDRPGRTAATAAATAAVEVIVRPGDTLSELAAEHGQADWRAAWRSNAGRREPDGSTYTDPDLIRPGWRLTIPASAAAPAGAASPRAGEGGAEQSTTAPRPSTPGSAAPSSAVPSPSSASPSPSPRPRGATPSTPAPAPAVPGGPGGPGVPRTTTSAQVTVPLGVADEPASPGGGGEAGASGWGALEVVAFAGGGGLLAAGALAALLRSRRRRFRDRTLGRTISSTPPELVAMEKALLARGPGGAVDVAWLDVALRSLVQTFGSPADSTAVHGDRLPGGLPDVVAVRLAADVLTLVLTAARPVAPLPWRVDESGLRWSLRRGAQVEFDARAGRDQVAPFPALVTVGRTAAGEHWLVDLERVGALSLTGDRQRCLDLARFLAAELAHNAWSERLQVGLVGFGAELAALNPSRVRHHDDRSGDDVAAGVVAAGVVAAGAAGETGDGAAARAVEGLHADLRSTAAVLERSGADVLAGRLRADLPGDGWAPHVLLIAPGPDASGSLGGAVHGALPVGVSGLLQALRAQRSRAAVALVLAGDEHFQADTRWQVHVDADGQLTIPALGVRLLAQQLPADEAADLAALIALTAQGADLPAPPARGDAPWDAYADATGAPLPEVASGRGCAADGGPRTEPAGSSVLPKPTSAYLDATATTAQDVDVLAPTVSGTVRRRVEDADPALDADLAAWADPGSGVAKLSLLGPVALSGPGVAPDRRLGFYTEVVAYLGSRPAGVTSAQFAAEFWPEDRDSPQLAGRVRNAISPARTWLGKNPRTGLDYLPVATEGRSAVGVYRVQGLLIDAELFRRLRLRGVARGEQGVPDLQAALELVAGPPLDRRRPDGWAWLVDTPLEHEYLAMIVDVAHLLATHHLAAGDAAAAEQAAGAALRAGSQDDVALLDLVAASDAAGNQAQAQAYVARVLANHGAEVEEDLPPRTYDVLRRRRWLPQDARAS